MSKDNEIQGFSHKRAELLKNRNRERDVREHNLWGKDENKQENEQEEGEARKCRFQSTLVFNMAKEVIESTDIY